MTRAKLFFAASANVSTELGRINNSIWCNAVALWTLRKEVQAFVKATGKDGQQDLHVRFVAETGVTSADLRTTCLKWSWDEHQAQLARVLLFHVCALYEGWLEDVVPRAVPSSQVELTTKALQFPTSLDAAGRQQGFKRAINIVNQDRSPLLVNDFFPMLITHRKNSWSSVEDLLIAYRYFKECRNTFIHAGGIANTRLRQTYQALVAINPHKLGLAHPLQLPIVIVGKPVDVRLPDVVALAGMLHSLIITVDAALAVSINSQNDLLERLDNHRVPGRALPKKDPDKKRRAIKSWLRKAGLPEPTSVVHLEQEMRTRGLA